MLDGDAPLMTSPRTPGVAWISVRLFKAKYSSQVALRYGLSQKRFQSSTSVFAHFSNISFFRVRFPNRQTLEEKNEIKHFINCCRHSPPSSRTTKECLLIISYCQIRFIHVHVTRATI